MKKVLFLTYFYPPSSSVATYRILGFTKYLQKYGWKPTVISTQSNYYQYLDNDLINQIPSNVEVSRVHVSFGRKFSNVLNTQNNKSRRSIYRLLKKIFPLFKSLYGNICYPDEYFGWERNALIEARRLLKTGEYSALITTGGPFTVLKTGLTLKKEFNIPWIVDIRDPLLDSPFWKRPLWQSPFYRRLERNIFKYADKVIVVSPGLYNLYKNKYTSINNKMVIILNGYDPDIFNGIYSKKSFQFTITHSGNLYGMRNPNYLLDGISFWLKNNPNIDRNNIRVRLVGSITNDIKKKIEEYKFDDFIDIPGFVSHKKSLEYMKESSVLVLIGWENSEKDIFIPAKTFEYIASNRPILGLITSGDCADLLVENGHYVVPPTNINEIALTLDKLYQMHDSKQLFHNNDKALEYSRDILTQKLAQSLSSLLEKDEK